MRFEDYCREEFEKINEKIDANSKKIEQLLIFMAVKQAEDAKTNKHSAVIISAITGVVVSTASYVIQRLL